LRDQGGCLWIEHVPLELAELEDAHDLSEQIVEQQNASLVAERPLPAIRKFNFDRTTCLGYALKGHHLKYSSATTEKELIEKKEDLTGCFS